MKKNIPNIGFTHAGTFHADDVLSTALLKILNPNFKVIRGFDVPEDFNGIVYDIGFGEYDHHQTNNEIRENGVPYASFGKLWRDYGENILNKKECIHFDHAFIEHLDLSDNTGERDTLASVISSFNPSWKENNSENAFDDAVKFAVDVLNKQFDKYKINREANDVVKKAFNKSDKNIVILDRYCPWQVFLSNTKAKFVIYPSQRGGYGIECVPYKNGKNLKIYFPESLRGKTKEELNKKIDGLNFVHNSGFFAAADSIDACIKLARYTEKEKKKENNISTDMGELIYNAMNIEK